MKTFGLILRIFFSVLVAIVGLAFAVVEATMLVTLDFMLYEHEFLAFLQIVLRFSIAAYALVIAVWSIVKPSRSFVWESIALFVACAVMIPFASNMFGVYFAALSVLFAIAHVIHHRAKNRTHA